MESNGHRHADRACRFRIRADDQRGRVAHLERGTQDDLQRRCAEGREGSAREHAGDRGEKLRVRPLEKHDDRHLDAEPTGRMAGLQREGVRRIHEVEYGDRGPNDDRLCQATHRPLL